MPSPRTPDLFEHALSIYGEGVAPVPNADLYQGIARRAGFSASAFDEKAAIGSAGELHSPLKRSVRWEQQNLKQEGLIERAGGARGLWRITGKGLTRLREIREGSVLKAFSTDLGVAVWGHAQYAFIGLPETLKIDLILTSPPYPLQDPRAYGNVHEQKIVDFICSTMEPSIHKMSDGASLVINVSNDIFLSRSPARSMYVERLVLAMADRFGLSLMDRLVWENPNKLPGPIAWASKKRVQLNAGYEPVFWFTNNPDKVRSNNQRVLQPHTEKHLRFIAAGGETRSGAFADGAHHRRPGAFSNPTAGKIPRNVLRYSSTCPDNRAYKADARSLGIPTNEATMPLALARFLVEFLTARGDLVADPFGGSMKTARAAESLGRLWVTCDTIWDYLRGGLERFRGDPGFSVASDFLDAPNLN